ncbi:SDR family NAD(P)-dependent oxidoreductase [Rhizobium sp. G21]|uniref:SDR family NAD(P)-dependent oxidoreductase n=1 Tax=Rhizobium sp. G21 TaxID=2758439 RepID=UPI0016003721|nr:SDR family oxidoreductase [Rhizobium sp. G21]MBB1248708.1 SDR family oxidoreductase [Rhizobium sp. G21]
MVSQSAQFEDLRSARVLITGGASGIGAALVAGFARQGAKVAFVDIDGKAAETTIKFVDAPYTPRFRPVDVSDIEATRAAVTDLISTLDGLDVLINNVGWDDRHDAEQVTEAYWDRNMSVNLRAAFFISQTCLPALKKSGRGAIINFSSIAFMMNLPDLPVYLTAKSGMIGMTKALAGQFGKDNVRVNAILPGMVLTERQKELWISDQAEAAHRDRQCLKFSLTAEDMVGPCLFLASDSARAITAQSLIVDGGYF